LALSSAVRSASTPSPTTFPAIGTSAGNRSRGGRSHRKAGERTPAAPPTFSEGRLGRAWISATRRRPSRRAPHEGRPSAGPLGRGEPPDASSIPRSCHAWSLAAIGTTTLLHCEEATMRTTLTCRSSQPPHWQHRHSTTARATGLHRRRCRAPSPSASLLWR
jgi:hypothetical protein